MHACSVRAGCICDDESAKPDAMQRRRLELEAAWRSVADAFVCICLAARDDRCAEASAQFHEYGLCRLVRFYRPLPPTDDQVRQNNVQSRGKFGSWTSHQHVCREFLQSTGERGRVMVFEDDVQFLAHRTSPEQLARIASAMQSLPPSWDAFYCGHFPYVAVPVDLRQLLFRTWSCQTHAYVLSRKGANRVADYGFLQHKAASGKESGLDNWIAWNLEQYAVAPQIAVQSASPSDVIPKKSYRWFDDTFLPWGLGLLRNHTAWVELLAYAGTPIVGLLVGLVLLSLVLSGLRLLRLLLVVALIATLVAACLPGNLLPVASVSK